MATRKVNDLSGYPSNIIGNIVYETSLENQ